MRLGADPEVFIAQGRLLVSSCGKVGGTKTQPLQIPDMPPGFTIQEDNVAVEFGIPPSSSVSQFAENIILVQRGGLRYIKEKINPELRFSNLNCTFFPKNQLNHPGALVFGCEPDFNGWTGQQNPVPIFQNERQRTAGGHIHVETTLDKAKVIQAMDITLGLATLFLDKKGDERRKAYGRAGAMRPKSYGVEYRVPSNYWIFTENLIYSVWKRTSLALELVMEEVTFKHLGNKVQKAINTGDKKMAADILSDFSCSVGVYE